MDGLGDIPLCNSFEEVIGDAQVVVDFTNAEGAMEGMHIAPVRGVNVVTGSTGFTQANLLEAERLANEHQTSIMVAPNFALGAVLVIHLAKMASRFFDYADLTEVHHEAKATLHLAPHWLSPEPLPRGKEAALPLQQLRGRSRRSRAAAT